MPHYSVSEIIKRINDSSAESPIAVFNDPCRNKGRHMLNIYFASTVETQKRIEKEEKRMGGNLVGVFNKNTAKKKVKDALYSALGDKIMEAIYKDSLKAKPAAVSLDIA